MDDDNRPSAKRNEIRYADKVISSLLNKLHNGCLIKENFDESIAKIIAMKNQLNHRQIQSLNESSRMGENFLMLACLNGNDNAVDFLIKCGLNLHKKDVMGWTASDYAWENKNFDCLAKLLAVDAPFPKDFDVKLLKVSINLKIEIFKNRTKIRDFHRNISEGNLGEIQKFVNENPNMRFAYDENNQCALTTALKCNKIEVYNFLRSRFFEAGIDSENHRDQLSKLPGKVQENARKQLKDNLGKPVKDHIISLLSKTRDRSGSTKNFGTILHFYAVLNEVPTNRKILELVAKSEKTDIVFDFNNEDCFEMDSRFGGDAFGMTDCREGYILIGAAREEIKVLATIAHELAHWAIQLVYNNEDQPFFPNDHDRVKYEKLVEKYKNSKNRDVSCSEIEEVFNSEHYASVQINKELIVRVPELRTLHKDDPKRLSKIRETYEDLFKYFEEKVLPDVENELLKMNDRKEIKEMNKSSGVLQEAKDSDMLSAECLRNIDVTICLHIKASAPMLVLENIIEQMNIHSIKNDTENLFVEVKQLSASKYFEKIKNLANSAVKPKIFVVDKTNYFDQEPFDGKMLQKIVELKPVLISSAQNEKIKLMFASKTEINFEWKDLNMTAREQIKKVEILFQGHKVRVDEIVKNEELFEKLPLEMVLSPFSAKLNSFNETLPKKPGIFIKRRFKSISFRKKALQHYRKSRNFENFEKNAEIAELCDFVSKNKSVLIADEAGMGKSTSAAELARDLKTKDKSSWVVFIDLKKHTKIFVCDHQKQPEAIALNFFTGNLLQLTTYFEQKLFEKFYADGKIFFIIDGFDEISPKYKDFVFKILKTIKSSENHLVVTTRPHFTEMLRKKLEMEVVKIEPFDKSNQFEFLIQSWKQNFKDIDLVGELLKKFKSSLESDDFWSTPIHIFMVAEVFKDSNNIEDFDTNIFELYEKFIKLKEKIWAQEKGPLAVDDNLELHNTFPATNLKQIFYRLAIEQIFSSEKADKLKIPKVNENVIDETIARVGIVAFDSNGFAQFTHRTYAEFFVADLIAYKAFNENPQREFVELFAAIILKSRNFEQVWKFLNDKLVKIDEFDTEILSNYFEKFAGKIESFSSSNHLSSPNKKSPPFMKLFSFIMEILNFGIELKRKIVSFLGKNFPEDFEYVIMSWRFFQKIQKEEEFLKELLSDRSQLKEILYSALEHEKETKSNESEQLLQRLIENAEKVFEEEDFLDFYFDDKKEFLDVRYFIECSSIDNFASFEVIWAAAEKKVSKINIKNILLGREDDGKTMLHMIARWNSKYLLKWLKNIRNFLDNEEFEEHLMTESDDLFIKRMLSDENLTKEDFERIWEFIEQNSSEETQKKLLFHERQKKILIEFSVTKTEDKSLINYIFDITDSILWTDNKTLIDFLRSRGTLADAILHMIVASDELFDKYSSKFKPKEFRGILLSRTSDDWNVLHFFVRTNNQISMWNRIVDEINDLKEVKRLLFEKGYKDQNVFHFAAFQNNDFLIELLEWCEKNFGSEFLESVFLSKDYFNDTLLHKVAEKSDENLYRKCFNFFSKKIELEKQREILRMKNRADDLPIQRTLMHKNEENGKRTANFYFELFEAEGIKKLFSEMKFRKHNFERSSIKYIVNKLQMKSILENYWKIEKLGN